MRLSWNEIRARAGREQTRFALADLPQHVEKFGFIIGVQRRTFRDQDPVNIEASERIARLHDALAESGYDGHDLELFLVRMVFCLFADDTGIFEPRDIFLQFIEERTSADGSDLGPYLARLFQALNTPEDRRQAKLDEDLARFPYINGALFAAPLRIPDFDAEMRQSLIDACLFDWTAISPAIFGALFQSVMEPVERRAQGTHYTTEQNIRKVIEPLFLDDLRAEFARLKARRDNRRIPDLYAFQQKLGQLRFLDPACGCGNFLIIAYRELRQLEIEVLRQLHPSGQLSAFAELLSVVNVDQFYGIEISEFPARIAETALWMMDHIMNNRLSLEFGQTYTRIPIAQSPHIRNADALTMDWAELLPPVECSYVFGNPPFVGAKFQSPEQRQRVQQVAALGGSGGTLDYVAAWFIRAGEYAQQGNPRIGFVATNSITQGEQVAQLWPILFNRCRLDIAFAHRTFAWGSDARGKAHVHVVIIGLDKREATPREKRLFAYPDIHGEPEETNLAAITPYLFDGGGLANPHLVVGTASQPINGLAKLVTGSQPIDGGLYILNEDQRTKLLEECPEAEPYIRPFVGSQEYLNGKKRWILWLGEAPPNLLRQAPALRERVAAVRALRKKSNRASTQALADTPTLFQINLIPDAPFLVVPEVSSERREYVPIGWLEPPVVPSNLVRVLVNATKPTFALLTSAMHMAWMRHFGGRLGSSYRYSIGVVYNTFPLPPVSEQDLQRLAPHADAVLAARANHPNATLADLYDPDATPPDLRRAHSALDHAVDSLYRRAHFASERERVEHLFALYEQLQAPLAAAGGKRKKRRTVKKR